jgi:hypothetical protein
MTTTQNPQQGEQQRPGQQLRGLRWRGFTAS